MAKNIVRKANKTIINAILRQIRDKVAMAYFFRNQDDLENLGYYLSDVRSFRQTVVNLLQIGVFNDAEYNFFVTEYVSILLDRGFSVRDIWDAKE